MSCSGRSQHFTPNPMFLNSGQIKRLGCDVQGTGHIVNNNALRENLELRGAKACKAYRQSSFQQMKPSCHRRAFRSAHTEPENRDQQRQADQEDAHLRCRVHAALGSNKNAIGEPPDRYLGGSSFPASAVRRLVVT